MSRPESPAAQTHGVYVCGECLRLLNEDETACPLPCPDHRDAPRYFVEVRLRTKDIAEAVKREYGVTT